MKNPRPESASDNEQKRELTEAPQAENSSPTPDANQTEPIEKPASSENKSDDTSQLTDKFLSSLRAIITEEFTAVIRNELHALTAKTQPAAPTPGEELAPTRSETPEEAYLRGRNEAIAERWEGLRGFPHSPSAEKPLIAHRRSVWD